MLELEVAIVGVGAMFPGRGDTLGFWRDILEGVDTLSDVPKTHWLLEEYYDPDPNAPDKTYGRRGGFLSAQAFDPVAFGIPPSTLQATDSAQLLALLVAQDVLNQAQAVGPGVIDRARTSVVLGVASATELAAQMAARCSRPAWLKGLRDAGVSEPKAQEIAGLIAGNFSEWSESTFPGLLGNVVAGRIANRLDLGGANFVTDAACASTLSALQVAINELRLGDSDLVITGGVDVLNDILMYMCFSKTPALSASGQCRPYCATADGTMLGEGIGMVALRRLADAERDGNRIHAVIRGLGAASDGRGTAIYAPVAEGQARALRRAYSVAGYAPATVELMEGHGTGTKAGDAAELAGLHQVFEEQDAPQEGPPWCALGSVKSQIGHTKAAAGAAGLLKITMALSQKIIPPTINVEQPAGRLTQRSPFYINQRARPWIRGKAHPRRASLSSFGFGGSNFHVTLQEYAGIHRHKPARLLPAELVLLHAGSPHALVVELERTVAAMQHEEDLARAADATLRAFGSTSSARLAIVASSIADFRAKAERLIPLLRDGQAGVAPLPQGVSYAEGEPRVGQVAFLFPGQGSQYVGMGADLAMAFADAREVWDSAADSNDLTEVPLHSLAFPATPFSEAEASAQAAELTRMEHAQPALAAVSLAQLRLLQRLGLSGDCTGGHSFGEVMALHAAGSFDATTALEVARKRGLCMAAAAGAAPGAMLAVQASAAAIASLLDGAAEGLVLANDNGPRQVVVSGPVAAIDALPAKLERLGLKYQRLPVASAFHSPIVASAIAPFAAVLAEYPIKSATLAVYSNSSGQRYPEELSALRATLANQIGEPVRFRQMIEAMYAAGVRTFVEVGAGSVLSGLVKHVLPERAVCVVALDDKHQNGVAAFLAGVGKLAVAGHSLDFAQLFADMPAPPKRTPPGKHAVEITGTNFNKPYPARAAGPKPKTAPVDPRPSVELSALPHDNRENSVPKPENPEQIAAFEHMYQQLATRHGEFIAAVTQAHSSFIALTAELLSGVQLPATSAAKVPLPAAAPIPPSRAVVQTEHATPVSVTKAAATAPASNGSSPRPMPIVPAAHSTPANGSNVPDVLSLVRDVIAQKTGYPSDMLEDDMDLQGDLGIDSIKQVEILSALRDRLPNLPEIVPAQISELRSIRKIADF